jgi:azurin
MRDASKPIFVTPPAGSGDTDIRRRSLLACALFALTPAWARHPGGARADLQIASDGDELRFVPDRLVCEERARVRLHFHHAGRISSDPHDWVLLKPGTAEAFIHDADRQTEVRGVPPQDRAYVIAATPLCPRGETVTVDFTAPAAGEYPFVCSVPGHGEVVQGILTVLRRARRAAAPAS